MVNIEFYKKIQTTLQKSGDAQLVAVSKLKPVADIQDLYNLGQRDFGENYVQELSEKNPQLPDDIRWHFIGHLQSNKVKFIAPFVHLIHSVDSYKLLEAINKEAKKNKRVINCLLQIYIAEEDSKFGMDEKQATDLLEFYTANKSKFENIKICGIMGMATFTDDETLIRKEYQKLNAIFHIFQTAYFLGDNDFSVLSMGMTDDFHIAIKEGSTMVRIGRALFGNR